MGARPSSFKKGGGYLNEVDATIVGYTFDVGDEYEIKKGARKGETFTPLSLVPEFQVDGEDEAKTQRLLIGDADFFGEVSEDGRTLYTPDGQSIGARSEAGLFIGSLCDGGFPEERFSDADDEINFEPMIGTRVRLVQQVNVEKTKRQGKQKSKDGKEYDRRDLLVQTVHDLPNASGKTNGKAAKPVAVESDDDFDVAEAAQQIIVDALGKAKDNRLPKSKLSLAIVKACQKGEMKAHRDEIDAWIFDDDNLNSLEDVSFDKKKQELSL